MALEREKKTEEFLVIPEAGLSYEAWAALMTAVEVAEGPAAELREQLRNLVTKKED